MVAGRENKWKAFFITTFLIINIVNFANLWLVFALYRPTSAEPRKKRYNSASRSLAPLAFWGCNAGLFVAADLHNVSIKRGK